MEKYIHFWYLEPDRHFLYLWHHCRIGAFKFLPQMWLRLLWCFHLNTYLNIQILDWLEIYLACLLEIILDPCLNTSSISIGVLLVLELGNYFDTSIGYLLCYSVDLALGTLIGTLMRPLLRNYLGRSLEVFQDFLYTFIWFTSISLVWIWFLI